MGKVLLVALALATLVVGILAFYVATYEPALRPASAERIETTPGHLARGAYLTDYAAGCFDCHATRDLSRYGGPVTGPVGVSDFCFDESVGFPGLVCPANITPDEETGIGAWTDGEILRAIREGVDRDGNALVPVMPMYAMLSDDDARSIVAYLRTIPAVRRSVPAPELKFPFSFLVKTAPRPLDGPVPDPDRANPRAYGEYLARVAGCHACHTPVDGRHQPIPGMDFAGGQPFIGPWGVLHTANLTPHETGIAAWSRDDFIDRFKALEDTEAVAVPVDDSENTAMPWLALAQVTEEDLGAIYDFLRTVPPIENRVATRATTVSASSAED